MKNKNKAKGAFMVEFALTLPMYLGVAFSTIFGSLMLHDEYVLQTTTQNLAREFAIDAASTVQTNAQTGIVYGNAVNSILKYRKTLDDSLYLYKTTNEKGKQCTISIECNARNVEGSSGVVVNPLYKMYKLDSAYVVLKGRIVPKEDLIPKLVQWVCPNTLDIIRKTRVELNINASLISKMDFDSEAGSKTGILHSQEYTADYGDYDLGAGEDNGDTSVDNTPNLNPVNTLIAENKVYAAARPSDYDDDYLSKAYLGSDGFANMFIDLLNTPALNNVMYTYLNGNDLPGLINALWKLGYLPTSEIDFFYSIGGNTEWNTYLSEYLRNYLELPTDYKISASVKTIIISEKNKSEFSQEELDMLTAGSLLDAKQFLYAIYTITAPDGTTKQDYFAIFRCDDPNIKALLTKDYVEIDPAKTNNGITMLNVGGITPFPTELGNYGNPNGNGFIQDTQPTHTQYEGEYMSYNSVYYGLDGTIVTENTNRWTNVFYDINEQQKGAYVKVATGYYEVVDPNKGVSNLITAENGASWTSVCYDPDTAESVGYVKVGNDYWALKNPDEAVANNNTNNWSQLKFDSTGAVAGIYTQNVNIDSVGYSLKLVDPDKACKEVDGTWKNNFFYDASGNNEGVFTKVTVGSITTYYKLDSTKDAEFTGASFVKDAATGLYYDKNSVIAGDYALINSKYYRVDKSSSILSTVEGNIWNNSYCDNSGSNEGVYYKINNVYYQLDTNVKAVTTAGYNWQDARYDPTGEHQGAYVWLKGNDNISHYYELDLTKKSDKTTGWDTLYYDANNVYNGAYVNNDTRNVENNAYFLVKDPGAGVIADSSSLWKNVKYDTTGKYEGAYVVANSSYYKVDNPQTGITAAEWSANGAVAKNVYHDTSGVNEGSYIKAGNDYYKLVDNTSDIAINSYQSKQLKRITGELYSDPATGKQYIRYDANSNSYYEVDTTVAPVPAPASGETNPWRNTYFDTRMTYTQNTQRYYRTYNTVNGVATSLYLEVPYSVGQTVSNGIPVTEPWTLIYNDYKVSY